MELLIRQLKLNCGSSDDFDDEEGEEMEIDLDGEDEVRYLCLLLNDCPTDNQLCFPYQNYTSTVKPK